MSWGTVALSLMAGSGWISFAVLSYRFNAVKRDRDLADTARKEQTKETRKVADIYEGYQKRQIAKLKDLEDEITQLEEELFLCDTPGSRRTALNRLLQTAGSAREDAERELPR